MTRSTLILIAAVARNGVIGKDNQLPWHLRADLQYFKQQTSGHTILMGRKTYDSIGKPLPNRNNLIFTRNRSFNAPGTQTVHSLEQAYAYCGDTERLYIIGGASLYELTLAIADELMITEVDANPEGNVFFPTFDRDAWEIQASEQYPADDENDYPYRFLHLFRRR